MPLPSRATDLSRLIADLATTDSVRRESAAARLAVIGSRAVPKLIDVARDRSLEIVTRATALRALSGIGDLRAAPLATAILDTREHGLVLEAIDLLGSLVTRPEPQATAAFDRLAELALNTSADVEHRLAAVDALDGLPDRLLRPLYEALAGDPASRVVARMARRQAGAMLSLSELIDRGLPDDPSAVEAAVRDEAGATRLTVLRRGVDAARARESAVDAELGARWRSLRGLLHQALAASNSRLALYDLRETLERATAPLPVGFVGAAAAVGDISCLAPIATAWTAARADERWWRDHLADAFGAIVAREGVRRRHPMLQKILKRSPGTSVLVARARP